MHYYFTYYIYFIKVSGNNLTRVLIFIYLFIL